YYFHIDFEEVLDVRNQKLEPPIRTISISPDYPAEKVSQTTSRMASVTDDKPIVSAIKLRLRGPTHRRAVLLKQSNQIPPAQCCTTAITCPRQRLKCSVFLFEKYIADKLHKPRRSEIVTHMLKREIKLLMQLKHPNLLHVIWPAEETSDSLAFATEQVSASLANLLGNHTRMPQPIPSEIQNFQFDDMVRKLCLYQLTSTLRFLHSGQALFHNNVSPGSILLTAQSQWRLAGLAFVEIIKDDKCESPRLKFPSSKALASPSCDPGFSPWTRKLPKMARPDTHYAAPECLFLTSGWATPFGLKRARPTPEGRAAENESFIEGHKSGKSTKRITSVPESRTATSGEIPGPWSDMFSLGLLICSLYSVGEPSPHSLCCVAQDRVTSLPSYDTKEHKTQPSGECNTADSVSQKDRNPDIIRARQLAVDMQLKFFNDPCLLSLYVLGNFAEKSDDERYKYLDVVRTHLNEFPKGFSDIIKQSKTELLVNIYAFTKHASAQSIEQLFVPIVCECLKSKNEEATLAAMESLKEMSAYFQQSDLDDLVLPGILEAYNMKSRQIKVTALTSLCSLVRQISQDALSNRVVPFLLETTTSLPMEDPKSLNVHSELSGRDFTQNYNILPNICDVWKEITSSRPMVMEPNLITKHVFPGILTHLLDSDLNLT
ncbi:HEAT repeat protein, partial [Opisthorchis viverrini]